MGKLKSWLDIVRSIGISGWGNWDSEMIEGSNCVGTGFEVLSWKTCRGLVFRDGVPVVQY